jgi:UDP-3-O-[3-hydroxymyristoyl] glucosamine N-acyltransferase
LVTVAAQGGIAGHVTVGDGAVLGGRSGVIADLEGRQTYFGYPARPMREWSRQQMHQKKIPKLLERIAALEERLAELEARLPGAD